MVASSTDDGMLDRRTVLGATGTILVGALAGCAGDASPGDDPEDETGGDEAETVAVGPDGEYVFTPGTEEPLRIASGTTVEFVWRSDTHNVAVESVPDGADWSGHEEIEDTGFEYSHTFTVAGRYEYVCTPHEGLGMTGAIVVE